MLLSACRGERPGPSADAAAVDAARASRRVVVMVMPLEGDGTSEVVELTELGDAAELRVRRVLHDDPVKSASTRLERSELDQVWELVERERLTELEPPESDPSARGGSSRMLLLEWPGAEGRTRVHALHWSNPRRPHPGIDRLFRLLAERARERAPGVALEYFP